MLPECRWSRPFCRLLPLAPVLILSGCATTTGPEPVAAVARDWSEEGFTGHRITTEHFELLSTVRDTEFEAALPRFVEAAYRRYKKTLPPPAGALPRLTVYLFGTRPEWERFTRRRYPARYAVYSRIRCGGYTEGETSASFYVTRGATLATIAHEGFHQYLNSRFDTPTPAWLNEGLACCHEAVDFAGPAPVFTPKHNTFRINALREALQRDRLMSLNQIVDTDAGRVISQHHGRVTQVYYAQAWTLVTFLRYGAGMRHAASFDRMLKDIADGTFSVHVSAARLAARDAAEMSLGAAAFKAYFGCAPEDLADDYYDYLVRVCGF